ncbi:MAG: hypothetical protein ACUVYA_03430 [Planctomycetota bacterium]
MTTPYHEPKYPIEAPRFVCTACSKEVPCGAVYYSAVFFEEAFRRKEYCPSCWTARFPGLGRAPAEDGKRAGKRRRAAPAASPEGTREAPPPPALAASGAEAEVFAFWRARRPEGPQERAAKLRFDPDVVLEFFRRLAPREGGESPRPPQVQEDRAVAEAVPDSERDELRFVLALLLLRKKALSFVSSQNRDGQEWLKLSEKKDPRRAHWVRNPELADSHLEKVRDRIGELLQMQV